MKQKINQTAPDFTLKDKDNNSVTLSKINSKYTILYFYPKDNTPGCTTEAMDFTKLKKDFEKQDATIIGISGGTNKTKEKFCTNNKLTITLLSDTDNLIGRKYGVYTTKKFMGREYMGYLRTTFVLDKNKKIIHIFENVKVNNHAKEVLQFITSL